MGYLAEALAGIKILEKVVLFATNCKFKKFNYYYDFYNRKTYVNYNGDGVILIECDLVVINPLKTKELIVNLDISDSKETTFFPNLDDMQKDELKPFTDFKFKCYSECGIISRVEESYASLSPTERKRVKNSRKHIVLSLKVDSNKIQKNKKYTVRYMFSIPGMFPITNGIYDDAGDDVSGECSSYMECNEHFKKIKYSLYLDAGISVNEEVNAEVKHTKSNDQIPVAVSKEERMFYNKYIVEVNKPKDNKYFLLSWRVNSK